MRKELYVHGSSVSSPLKAGLFDGVDLIADVRQAAFAVIGREDIWAFASLDFSEQVPHRLAHGNALVPIAFRAFLSFADNIDEAILEVETFPFQASAVRS
ncbi:MAG: hypothetical protein LBB52_07075 [Desulfovibrio sp.]|nr:hypothetical protein [Desulfovibrio sp.]